MRATTPAGSRSRMSRAVVRPADSGMPISISYAVRVGGERLPWPSQG
jgi:hypothetical protein